MKKNLLSGLIVFVASSLLAADTTSKDDVKNAATALGGQANYSWHSAVESPSGGGRFNGPADGKTEKGGFTWVSMTRGDNAIEVVIHGTNGAIKTPDSGWQSLAEASQDDGSGGFNLGAFVARMAKTYKAPAAEAAGLADQAGEMKKDGDAITGDLTEDGAKALLTFRRGGNNGGNAPTVTNPKGSVKFWVADGKLTKYQFHVTGTVSFNGNDRDVDRTTTVEIKDVNATKIDISADAKKKLE